MVVGEDQSSEWGTFSLSCLLDIHVVIHHKHNGLEFKGEVGAEKTNLSVMSINSFKAMGLHVSSTE